MAAASYHGRLAEFSPGIDTVENYKERVFLYCTANSIEDEDKQKAVFLTSFGGTTYTQLKNLVRSRLPQDLELEALIDVIKRHYHHKVVVTAERFKFFKRQQREGESITVYLSELRRLAKNCEFGEYLQTALRDQLACGLNSETLQKNVGAVNRTCIRHICLCM